jgi:hypothetical protein
MAIVDAAREKLDCIDRARLHGYRYAPFFPDGAPAVCGIDYCAAKHPIVTRPAGRFTLQSHCGKSGSLTAALLAA